MIQFEIKFEFWNSKMTKARKTSSEEGKEGGDKEISAKGHEFDTISSEMPTLKSMISDNEIVMSNMISDNKSIVSNMISDNKSMMSNMISDNKSMMSSVITSFQKMQRS